MRKHRSLKFMTALTFGVILGIVAWAVTTPPIGGTAPDAINWRAMQQEAAARAK